MTRNYRYSSKSKRILGSVHSKIHDVCVEAMNIANTRKAYAPDFGISSGHRSLAEQQSLYAIGRTVDTHRTPVTNCDGITKLSSHQSSRAVDIYCYVDGHANYTPDNLAQVATCFFEAAMKLGVTLNWGGSWVSSADMPHFEVVI
jgi:hypothetical protein